MKKKIRKAIGALLLAVAVAITQIPATNVEAASDFQMDENTLMKYTGTTAVVSVPAGTKVIAEEAFAGCTTMTSLQLPGTLEKISAAAFRGCTGLSSVKIPEGCEVIGNQAFADCTLLVDVSIPSTVRTIESGAFAGDKRLGGVTVSTANQNYVSAGGALYTKDMKKLVEVFQGRADKSYVMPATVSSIEKYAFWGCGNLREITLSNYLDEIPPYAFSFCRNLEGITLPYSVNRIESKAFENCLSLEDAVIPASVSYISPTAFDGCAKLNIISEAGSVAERFFQEFDGSQAAVVDYEENDDETVDLTRREKADNTSDVSNVNPGDVSDATVVETPDGADVLGRTKIVYQQAVVFVDNTKMEVLDGSEPVPRSEPVSSVSDNRPAQEQALTQKYTIVNGDTIASKAFYGDTSLVQYGFPKGIEHISDFAFARSGLQSVTIPGTVEDIGYGAFYHCDNLQSVSIPSSVKTIEPAAFTHTKWLESWKTGGDVDDFLVVGDGILIAYKGMRQSVVLPDNVKKIGAEVFQDHNEITAVYLPDGLEEIGEDAFNGCYSLRQLSGGTKLKKICDRAFYGCPLSTVRIPATVEKVGLQAYGGNEEVKSVVFQGTKLPELSYEKTATRLSNEDFRDLAFGCETAVVDGSITEFEDTILDTRMLGFRGVVVSIQSEPTPAQYGSARLEYCSIEPDPATGIVKVPDSVQIFGEEYRLSSVNVRAFDPYKIYESWAKYKPTDISIESSIAQGVNVKSGITFAEEAGAYKRTVSENSAYITVSDEDRLVRDGGIFTAEFKQRQEDFYLHLSKSKDSKRALKEAVEDKYGEMLDEKQLYAFDMSLYDHTDTVPITKLGKEALTVTMQVPPGMEDDTLCVVTLDDNGQLETDFVNYVVKNEKKCIQFRVTHFSPYGIYAAKGQLAERIDEKISNPSGEAGLDESPDTGDPIDPKWFLAGGFLFLALFLMFRR
ncbi:MAG: leucine-rich repeat domain-containing protein [Lachnospiraceae bacterium]|jgi:hypothetical protein|nr:leucine-rich repeat domain-containing protein [Lachnospiraceae bacterium]